MKWDARERKASIARFECTSSCRWCVKRPYRSSKLQVKPIDSCQASTWRSTFALSEYCPRPIFQQMSHSVGAENILLPCFESIAL